MGVVPVLSPSPRPVVFEREVACRSSPAELWPRFADTERLNRHIGSAPLEVVPSEDGGVARFAITTWVGPAKLTYFEDPYSWREGASFSFRRRMAGGLATTVTVGYSLEPQADGTTRVEARFEALPRFAAARPLVWLLTRQNIERLVRFVQDCDRAIVEGSELALARSGCDRGALDRAMAELVERHEPARVEALARFIAEAPDLEVARIRPYVLAQRWGAPRRAVLRLCLDAVRAGALSLEWALLCPSCRTGSEVLPSLAELGEDGHCHACDLRFDLDLDRAVEAVFRPQARVRPVDPRPFCIGGPMLTPHVVAQAPLPAGARAQLGAPAEPGRYRVFARGGATAVVDVAPEGAREALLRLSGASLEPRQLSIAPGGTLGVLGDDQPRFVKLERRDWSFPAATAHQVSLLPEFRRHFGKEALRPELALSVGRVAVLFSDLCDSTALYSQVGDPTAFGVVTDCLRFGSERVEAHGGIVVKTMGDAIMAAFEDPEDALRAAAAMLGDWEGFTDAQPLARALDLKLGMAVGTCMVMSANGALDYFGQTVNTAARCQHLAGARELVVAAGVWAEHGSAQPGLGPRESFRALAKGIDGPLDLVRVSPSVVRKAQGDAWGSEPASI